ncbi:hypothetical protein GGX14DRAFT_645949 [Mycena pura]|uniref:Uncharacterized protein n=1 Tax=Mycena pura TaxID=153505 RepID=A0AAD6V7D3_9AGAR|nr:hypothetical protein GGX14DRAFT_645949 [Mycena pura]
MKHEGKRINQWQCSNQISGSVVQASFNSLLLSHHRFGVWFHLILQTQCSPFTHKLTFSLRVSGLMFAIVLGASTCGLQSEKADSVQSLQEMGANQGRAWFESFKVNPAIKSNVKALYILTFWSCLLSRQILKFSPLFSELMRRIVRAEPFTRKVGSNFPIALFFNFLPMPSAEEKRAQAAHIVHEAAFQLASVETHFPETETLALVTGSARYPATARCRRFSLQVHFGEILSFFASGTRSTSTFVSNMGNFAQQSLPFTDSATLVIQWFLYWSKVTPPLSATYRASNCIAVDGNIGVNLHADTVSAPSPATKAPPSRTSSLKKLLANVIMDTESSFLDGSFGPGTFYMQMDSKTSVLALPTMAAAFSLAAPYYQLKSTTVSEAGLIALLSYSNAGQGEGYTANYSINYRQNFRGVLYDLFEWTDANNDPFSVKGLPIDNHMHEVNAWWLYFGASECRVVQSLGSSDDIGWPVCKLVPPVQRRSIADTPWPKKRAQERHYNQKNCDIVRGPH